MKEEELLLFKEELHNIKLNRYSLLGAGIFIVIFGVFVARTTFTGDVSLYRSILLMSFVVATVCILISELKYGRDYKDKLKELKKE